MSQYDSVIIGAGHNGLVCAAFLARAGQKVLVLESAQTPGGLAARGEFGAGFRAPVAHTVNHFPGRIAEDLSLEKHGLMVSAGPRRIVGLSLDGHHVVVQGSMVTGADAHDIDAYAKFSRQMRRFADALEPFWLKTIPRAAAGKLSDLLTFGQIGLRLRRLGKDDMREFMRVAALPARDLVDVFNAGMGAESVLEILKAMLCWDGLIGSRMAPRSPNNAVLPMLYRLSGDVRCEPGNLIEALHGSATAFGAEIQTGRTVDRILVRGGEGGLAAHGVRLDDGQQIEADRVISSADPQTTFFRLLGARHLEIGFTQRIRRLRCDGLVAKLHLVAARSLRPVPLNAPRSP